MVNSETIEAEFSETKEKIEEKREETKEKIDEKKEETKESHWGFEYGKKISGTD